MARKLAEIDRSTCVACGCCVKVCPKKALSIFRGLYAQVEADTCVGCGKCVKTCPADIIALLSREVVS